MLNHITIPIKLLYIGACCIFFSSLIVSCNHSKLRNMERILTSNSHKYWFRYQNVPTKPYLIGYCFENGGTYDIYFWKKGEKVRYKMDNSIYIEPLWAVLNDSTIMIGKGYNFKIVHFTDDSIILKALPENVQRGYFKLFREYDQATKPVQDTTNSGQLPGL